MHIFAEESPGHFRLTGAAGDDVIVETPHAASPAGRPAGIIKLTVASFLSGFRTTAWLLAAEATVVGQHLLESAATVDTAGEEE